MRNHALFLTMTALSQMTLADDDVFQLGVIEVNGESGKHQASNKETISGEALPSQQRFIGLAKAERLALIRFLESL